MRERCSIVAPIRRTGWRLDGGCRLAGRRPAPRELGLEPCRPRSGLAAIGPLRRLRRPGTRSSPASRRATTTLAVIWAAATPSARDFTRRWRCGRSRPTDVTATTAHSKCSPASTHRSSSTARTISARRSPAISFTRAASSSSSSRASRSTARSSPRAIRTTPCREQSGGLVRHFEEVLCLCRRVLRHGLRGLLRAGPARVSREPQAVARD